MNKKNVSIKLMCFILFLFVHLLTGAQSYEPLSKGHKINHTYYTLSYNEDFEQAEWVYYTLTPDMLEGNTERTNDFREDSKVYTHSASLDDYRGSGYDKGHLCPAADMKMNHVSMSESFFLSNMSPQLPSFNRGVWKELEMQFRFWAKSSKLVHIVTGPVFLDNKGAIGSNKVIVPGYYYKIMYIPSNNQMIGFLLPNKSSYNNELTDYVCSVDSIEAITLIDFFPQLDDEIEYNLEECVDVTQWKFFKSNADNISQPDLENRCQGITGSGGRCKRTVKKGEKYCWQHGQ